MEAQGPFCQSCGLPLETAAEFGVATDGKRVNDYCQQCYRNGVLVMPSASRETVTDRLASLLGKRYSLSQKFSHSDAAACLKGETVADWSSGIRRYAIS